MLQLVFGRSGYGKTEYIRNRIADKIDRGETQVLLITPEQYSFISEYSLLEQLGEARRRQKAADQGRQGHFDENGH